MTAGVDLTGKTAIITGSNTGTKSSRQSILFCLPLFALLCPYCPFTYPPHDVLLNFLQGMGFETARVMVKRGAKVILACRDEAKGQAALALLQLERQAHLGIDEAVEHDQATEIAEDGAHRSEKKKKKSKASERTERNEKEESLNSEDAVTPSSSFSSNPSSSVAPSSDTPSVASSSLPSTSAAPSPTTSSSSSKPSKPVEDVTSDQLVAGSSSVAPVMRAEKIDSFAPEFIPLDLASFASIRAFASTFLSKKIPLNILVNNASAMATKYGQTEDGLEIMFGVGQVGHFLLTGLLIDKMIQSADECGIPSRVVILTSTAAMTGSRDVVKHPITKSSDFSKLGIYSELKLANGLFAMELQRRLDRLCGYTADDDKQKEKQKLNSKSSSGATSSAPHDNETTAPASNSSRWSSKRQIIVAAVHPGIVETELSNRMMPSWFFKLVAFTKKTVPQGAATTCFVACHPSLEAESSGGKYWEDSAPAKPTSLMNSKSLAQKLWIRCSQLTQCSVLPQEGEEAIDMNPLNSQVIELSKPSSSSHSSESTTSELEITSSRTDQKKKPKKKKKNSTPQSSPSTDDPSSLSLENALAEPPHPVQE